MADTPQNDLDRLIAAHETDMENGLTLEDAEPGQQDTEKVETKAVTWEEFPDAQSMRSRIFSIPDIKEELVQVEEWGMEILVRGLTAKERAKVLQSAMRKDGSPDLEKIYPDLVIFTARHPTLKTLIFAPPDREELNKKSGGVLERLAMTAARLSGLDPASQEKAAANFN